MVFLYLRKTEDEIYYYKTKNNLEVDFLIKEKEKVKSLIQVSATIKNYDKREGEIKSLFTAMKELKLSQGIILTEDEEEDIVSNGTGISVIPLWKWLLR